MFLEGSREDYIKQQEEELQKLIIKVKGSSTSTLSTTTWSHRTTGCDVISMVTTSILIGSGSMKDIKDFDAGVVRIRAPSRKHGILLDNPLEEAVLPDSQGPKIRICNMLKEEHSAFMSKLKFARKLRSTSENVAAIIIQSYYRRYSTIKNFNTIRDCAILRQTYRKEIMKRLKGPNMKFFMYKLHTIKHGAMNKSNDSMLTLKAYRSKYATLRRLMAERIQRTFRCFISRRLLRTRRIEFIVLRKCKMVIRIQCMVRKFCATRRVRKLISHRREVKRNKAVLLIQKVYRRHQAMLIVTKRRYKLHYIASRMIQQWYRLHHSKRKRMMLESLRLEVFRLISARRIQRVARRYICRSLGRMSRIRRRKHFIRRFRSITKIQRVIRKCIAKRRVLKIRQLKADKLQETLKKQKELKNEADMMEILRKEIEMAKEEEDLNIFTHVIKGDMIKVGDLFEMQTPTNYFGNVNPLCEGTDIDVGGKGDTILTLSAAYGWKDLVHKCLSNVNGWTFDINYRNPLGETALIAAVKNNRYEVVKYLLDPLNNYYNGVVKPDLIELDATLAEAVDYEEDGKVDEDTAAAEPETIVEPKNPRLFMNPISNDDCAVMLVYAVEHSSASKSTALLELLLAAQFTVNSTHPLTLENCLHVACRLGDELAFTVIVTGTNIGKLPTTIAEYAANLTNTNKDLMSCGIDMRNKDDNGQTLVHKACAGGNMNILMSVLYVCVTEDGNYINPSATNRTMEVIRESPTPTSIASASQSQLLNASASRQSLIVENKPPETPGKTLIKEKSTLSSFSPDPSITDTSIKKISTEKAELISYTSSWSKRILQKDVDGKNSLLTAALNGSLEIFELLLKLVSMEKSTEKKNKSNVVELESMQEEESPNQSDAVPQVEVGEEASLSFPGPVGVLEKAYSSISSVRGGSIRGKSIKSDWLENNVDEEYFWSPNDVQTVLNKVIANGHVKCLNYLLNVGYDVLLADERNGCNCLMQACFSNQLEVLQVMLKYLVDNDMTVDLNKLVDSKGRNAFFYAVMSACNLEILSYLISNEYGTKVNSNASGLLMQDNDGWTALHVAIYNGYDVITSIELLARKELIQCLKLKDNEHSLTPLLLACVKRNEDVINPIISLINNITDASDCQSIMNMTGLKNRNAIWYLYHEYYVSVPLLIDQKYVSGVTNSPPNNNIFTNMISDEILISLLKLNCPLFSFANHDSLFTNYYLEKGNPATCTDRSEEKTILTKNMMDDLDSITLLIINNCRKTLIRLIEIASCVVQSRTQNGLITTQDAWVIGKLCVITNE